MNSLIAGVTEIAGEFNWIDAAIAVFLIVSLIQGIRTGLIRSIFTVVGIAAGLTAAILCYARISSLLLNYLSLPGFIADTVSFIFLFSVTAVLIHCVGSLFALITRFSLIRAVDRIGGGGTGLVIGLFITGVLLILLTAFPVFSGFQHHVDQSTLAPPIIENTANFYEELTELLPVDIPRLTAYPEDLVNYFHNMESAEIDPSHPEIDFAKLDGTACFVCDGPVEFLGFPDNKLDSFSPKFICSDCGRTSDGCQTYEGYHQMYGNCPVEMGNRGYRFDCGIWTNHSYHRPSGPCPVCGKE